MIRRIKARLNIWRLCWKFPETYKPLYKLDPKYVNVVPWENALDNAVPPDNVEYFYAPRELEVVTFSESETQFLCKGPVKLMKRTTHPDGSITISQEFPRC